MAVVEMIYLVAATLWILVVASALCLGVRFMVKLRGRRRRMNRLIAGVRLPIRLGSAAVLFLRWCEHTGRPYTATAGKTALTLQRLISDFPNLRIARPPREVGGRWRSSAARRGSIDGTGQGWTF